MSLNLRFLNFFVPLNFNHKLSDYLWKKIKIMTRLLNQKIPLIIEICFVIETGLIVAYFADFMLHNPFQKLFDLDAEANLPTYFSSIQLLLVAFFLGVFARKNFNPAQRHTWTLWVLPVLFLFLSLDEFISLHEFLGSLTDVFLPGGSRDHTIFAVTGLWMFILGIPFILFLASIMISMSKYLKKVPGVWFKFNCGFALYLSGALGVEILGNFTRPGTWGYVLQVAFEEGLEMLGVTFILWAVFNLVKFYGFRIEIRPYLNE
ncbi:MAG: hypothetical protein D6813_09255 [Calditrichaeota bacterium]|nr:MAG: hypothetical protein D6813_09255 [Calditrichota bacterium]